jgi:hypothetical protein
MLRRMHFAAAFLAAMMTAGLVSAPATAAATTGQEAPSNDWAFPLGEKPYNVTQRWLYPETNASVYQYPVPQQTWETMWNDFVLLSNNDSLLAQAEQCARKNYEEYVTFDEVCGDWIRELLSRPPGYLPPDDERPDVTYPCHKIESVCLDQSMMIGHYPKYRKFRDLYGADPSQLARDVQLRILAWVNWARAGNYVPDVSDVSQVGPGKWPAPDPKANEAIDQWCPRHDPCGPFWLNETHSIMLAMSLNVIMAQNEGVGHHAPHLSAMCYSLPLGGEKEFPITEDDYAMDRPLNDAKFAANAVRHVRLTMLPTPLRIPQEVFPNSAGFHVSDYGWEAGNSMSSTDMNYPWLPWNTATREQQIDYFAVRMVNKWLTSRDHAKIILTTKGGKPKSEPRPVALAAIQIDDLYPPWMDDDGTIRDSESYAVLLRPEHEYDEISPQRTCERYATYDDDDDDYGTDEPQVDNPAGSGKATVTAQAVRKKSKLKVDVGPDTKKFKRKDFTVKIYKKRRAQQKKRWKKHTVTTTTTKRHRVTVDVPRGRYRVVVPAQFGLKKAKTANVIRIKR